MTRSLGVPLAGSVTRSRRFGMLASLAVLGSALAVTGPGTAQAAVCTAEPVLASATRNGSSDLGGFKVDVSCSKLDGSQNVGWNVTTTEGAYDLGSGALDDTWKIKIRTGSVVPRVTATHGAGVSVTRTQDDSDRWYVEITAKPVLLLGECDQGVWPWTCPHTATQQWDGYLDGEITDYGSWEDAEQRAAFFGMDYSSDISAGSVPPEVVSDPRSGAQMIRLLLANPHYTKGGALFRGNVKVRIPNAFLKTVYEIDAPATLTSAGLSPDLSGTGAGTVTVTDAGTALVVEGKDMTFSARSIKVHRGTIVPRKPTNVAAKRTGATTGKLTFTAATPRGSKVTGHLARCVARTGTHVVTDREYNGPPQYISGLRRGVAYDCTVRGTSKAGPGTKSVVVRIPKTV
jgi:hypothetical protein